MPSSYVASPLAYHCATLTARITLAMNPRDMAKTKTACIVVIELSRDSAAIVQPNIAVGRMTVEVCPAGRDARSRLTRQRQYFA